MTKTRDNHYVPQWHQKGFLDENEKQLCYLTRREFPLPSGELKVVNEKKWFTPAQRFYELDLYSTFFGDEVSDDIERKLFGPIDDNGSKSVWAYLSDDQSLWHSNFSDFFTYIDAQKLRTPKGLDWIKTKYPKLTQEQLMVEMQALRNIHCTLWAEGVRELVSAVNSDVKFIVSDHPVTIYNYACPPDSEYCTYPKDPDITLKGSQTIFPLDKNRCLILTNLEYAQNAQGVNPLEQRTNSRRTRQSMVSTINFINSRKLTADDVTHINYIIKNRSKSSIAAGREEWLYPEDSVKCNWEDIREILLPPTKELYEFDAEMYAKFDDGTVLYQDALGRTTPSNDFHIKNIDEEKLGRNDFCGCGSGRKYKSCCQGVDVILRTSWSVNSIRERNLIFCNCIRDVLGLSKGHTWKDVRKNISEEQIKTIYEFYSYLWPSDTDIYSLLPKSDRKFRGLYSGILDIRVIMLNALPMASVFDEFMIQNPITNPINIKPEFNPIQNPGRYKYQALKEFLFILEMEPYIDNGLVNLIPDPSDFDMGLKMEVMELANSRMQARDLFCERDCLLQFELMTDDLLNSTASMERDARIRFLTKEFGVNEREVEEVILKYDADADNSHLSLLQHLPKDGCGQFIQYRMEPNHEMALFIAQVTGAILVTDSDSRWRQFMSAQHRVQGIASYPWAEMANRINKIPIDEALLSSFTKSQGIHHQMRNCLKMMDKVILEQNKSAGSLAPVLIQIDKLVEHLGQDAGNLIFKKFKLLSPDGGFYNANVQRLLVRSSCLSYDHMVRTIYGIDLSV